MTLHAQRCPWCGDDPLYVAYHDREWGVPLRDSRALWALLMLEGFQAGLSWITILRRREAFYESFQGFQPEIIAQWGEAEVAQLLQDARIIRHRGKIESVIKAARAYLRIEAREGFATWIWSFVDGQPQLNAPAHMADVPTQTETSNALSKALKKEGFSFCGPVICYAFMQSAGLVNDHLTSCYRRAEISA